MIAEPQGPGSNVADKVGSIDLYFSYKLKYKDFVLITDANRDKYKAFLYGDPKVAEPFPKIWMSNGTIQPLPKGRKVYEQWPPHRILNYPIYNFRVYVNDKDYFMSQLPKIHISTSIHKSKWSDAETYYRMVLFTYLSTYCCGISMQHLSEPPNVPGGKIITSLMRFHLYFTIRRLLSRASSGESVRAMSNMYNGGALYGKSALIFRNTYFQGKVLPDGTVGQVMVRTIGDVANDYKRYVPTTSDGLTKVGTRLLNDSIAGYVYAVLGAQAKIRASIIDQGAISLQCQDVFRKLVEDSIVSNDVVVGVSNMRRAVSDCNQVLNLAITPDVFLLPSDMTILKERIPGYSNILYRAVEKSMVFGTNSNANYHKPIKRATRTLKGMSDLRIRSGPARLHPKENEVARPRVGPSVSCAQTTWSDQRSSSVRANRRHAIY